MLTVEKAKKIGISYCADVMGRDFVEKYADSSSTGFSECGNNVFCFLGIDDSSKVPDTSGNIVLTNSKDLFPYRASCMVSLYDGKINDFKYVHP